MNSNDYVMDIIAVLNKQLSKQRIKNDLKSMDNSMFIKVISKLSIALSQRQLKKDLKQLNDLYLQIGADLKIDNTIKKKLQSRIKTLQESISDLQIGVRAKSSDIVKTVAEAKNKGQRVANRTPIDFSIQIKKEKAIADLEYMAKKYSKLFSNASASQKYNNILDAAYGITDAKQLADVRAQIAAFTSELKANNLASQSLGDKWKSLIDRAKDLFSAASAVTLILSQVKQAVTSFLQLDTAMTNLYKVSDQITSRDQFSGLLTRWNKLAQNLAVTTKSLIGSMEAWSKIGFDLDMSEQLAEITAIFEKTAEISNEKATSTLISAAQAFTEIDDLGTDDYVKRVEAVGSKINAIGNKYAIDSEGLADGLQNASAALKVAGNDLNETIALITTTNKIYQSPEEGSNMLKVASMRLRGQVDALKEMGEDAEGVSTDLTKIQQQIYELTGNRVNIFEDEENLKSTYQMILEIGEVFDSLNDRSQADLLETMFGKQRASAGASLLLNYEELEKVKNDSINAGNSMAEEYSKYMESAEASLTIFKEKLIETYSTFMSGDLIKYTADMGNGLLDLVNATDLLRHGLVGIISLNIGKGITSIGASIASTAKQFNMLGSALQQVKNLPVDSTRVDVLEQVGKATKSLTEKNLKLLLSQKQLKDSDKETILRMHDITDEEAKLKLEKLGLLSVTKTQTTANVAEAATTGTLKNAMLSLKASAIGTGNAIKAAFLSNPIGIILTGIATAISITSTAISKHNEKLEEARQANIESATTASQNANKLKDLYSEYNRLASIQDRTTSEEELFKTAVENIVVALGDKSEALENLTAGTDEYADALARVTKEELQSQAVTATIGRKSAEEELQGKTWDKWGGSQVSIDSNSKGKALSNEAQKAVNIVSESLKEYETVNRTWKNISWDIDSDDPVEALEYYNSLVEAREKLVSASKDDESLLDTEIYEDLSTAINSMSESLNIYIEKLYEEEKLHYMAQNGIPTVTEEYKEMESALVSAAGSSVDLQDRFKELLTADFSDLAINIENVSDAVSDVSGQLQIGIPLSSQLTTSQESLDKFQSSIKSAAEAYSTLLQGNYTSNELLSSIQAINQAVTDMGGSLNWEFINGQTDSLKLLGDTIKYISEQYANSVLNDMEIDTDSGFGQMLANIIQNAYESEAALAAVNTQIESMQNAYNDLNSIIETYNETGYLTFDQLQQVLEMEPEYLACLTDENGQLALNTEAMLALANQRLNDAEAQAVQQAITELGQLALQDEKTAVEENAEAFTNAVNDLASYNNELANTIAEATIGASAIRDLNGAISGAQAQGATDDQIETVLNNLNAKMQLIQNTRSKLSTSTLGGMMGDKQAKSSAKKTVDAYLEEFKKALEVLNTLGEQGKITEQQRLDQLRILYKRYFENRKEYLKEYMEYEHEYLEGLSSLYRSAMSGIVSMLDKQADAYGDQKDAAVDSLKAEKDAAAEVYEQQIKNIEAQQKAIDVEIKSKKKVIDGIQQEIDKIKEAQQEREQEINLQKQKMALARAENQKTKKVYTENGFIFEADTEAIQEARNAVKDAETTIEINNKQKQIDQIEREIDLLEERKTLLDEEKASVQEMLNASNENFDKMIEQTEKYFDNLIEGINKYAEQWKELADMEDQAKMMADIEEILARLGYNLDDVMNTSNEAYQAFKNSYLNIMSDIYDGNSQMLSSFSELSGVDMSTLNGHLAETEEYINRLSALDLTDMGTAIQSLSDNFGAVGDSIGGVTNAISGGGSASRSEEKSGNGLGSGGESSGTSLTGSMDELKSKADATLGTGGEDGSGTGMIGQFGQTEQKVTDVTAAIGNGEGGDGQAEGKAEGGGTLTSSITNLGETSNEVLGEPGGEGVIGKFGQMEEPLLEANEHVTGISDGLAEIDGQEVECTIKVNIEQNGELPTHAEGTLGDINLKSGEYTAKYGKAFAKGTGDYKGLPKAEKNALVSEYGQTEMTVLPDGTTIVTDKPTMMNLPKDTVIFNEDQTKQIMDNEPQVVGNAHADGTGDSIWTTLADGTKVRPLQPGDKMYDLVQKFDAYFKSMDGNLEKLVPNSFYEHQRQMEEITKQINYVNSITNNNRNVQPVINIGDITVQGVQDVNGLAQAIKLRLPGMMLQEYFKN